LEYAVNPATGEGHPGGSGRLSANNSASGDLQDGDEAVLTHESPVQILRSVPDLRRKVSRVESLRRLILGASHLDSHRLFDKKKYRIRRSAAAAGKVDKAIGTDIDLMGGGGFSEDDLFDRTSSRFNASCESFDLDSVSQLSLVDTGGGEGLRTGSGGSGNTPLKSISIDNIPSEVTAYHRTAMSHAFMRSRLASLPEENPGLGATLGRQPKEEKRPRSGSLVVALPPGEEDEEEGDQLMLSLTGPQSLGSDIIRPLGGGGSGNGGLSRKRSQSMADIIQRVAQAAADVATPDPLHQHLHHRELREPPLTSVISRHKMFTKTRSEESGYDSDTTRKSGSSPRGSVKSDSFDPSETDSSTCVSHLKSDLLGAPVSPSGPTADLFDSPPTAEAPEAVKPRMKKPPRKSKEEQRRVEISCQTENIIGDGGDAQCQTPPPLPPLSPQPVAPVVATDESDVSPGRPTSTLPLNFAENIPTTLPSLTSKSFKMVRLFKSATDELGIIISKKRNPSKGTTGYIIAHIEPDGLVNR